MLQTHTDKVLFSMKSGYANAPQYYVIRTLPVLFALGNVCRNYCASKVV